MYILYSQKNICTMYVKPKKGSAYSVHIYKSTYARLQRLLY